MRKALALVVTLLALGWGSLGQQTLRLLIVDQTGTMEESLRILAFVRAVRATGLVTVKALAGFPTEPWTEEPFLFAIVIPPQTELIWFCTPAPVNYLPNPLPEAYNALAGGLVQAFEGRRQVRGSHEDVYVLFLSGYLQRLNYLVGVDAQ